jgi:hypothetical protein
VCQISRLDPFEHELDVCLKKRHALERDQPLTYLREEDVPVKRAPATLQMIADGV